ncbi:hypothetical protein ACPSLZ_22610 [Vibrio campbellii]|uniref:hypothetical protein n=1 Tax=Vibrio campbellii TaxID=680 RepID=UPI003CE5015C
MKIIRDKHAKTLDLMVTFNGTQELFDSAKKNMNGKIRTYVLENNPGASSDEVFASPYTDFFAIEDWSKMVGLSLDGVGSALIGGNYMTPMQRNMFLGYKYNEVQTKLNLVELFATGLCCVIQTRNQTS